MNLNKINEFGKNLMKLGWNLILLGLCLAALAVMGVCLWAMIFQ